MTERIIAVETKNKNSFCLLSELQNQLSFLKSGQKRREELWVDWKRY